MRRPMGWGVGALLLGIAAWVLVSGWQRDRVEAGMVVHRDVLRMFMHGERLRTTGLVGAASLQGLNHTQQSRGRPRSKATGVLFRPDDDPPAAWLLGSEARLDLDILERADRQLVLMLGQATEGRQDVTVFFNGIVLGRADLHAKGKTRLLYDVKERQQRHGLNHVDLHFARTTPVTFEGETVPYPVAARLFHFGLLDEGQGPAPGGGAPRRVHLEHAIIASRGTPVLVVPGGAAARTALRLPDTGRMHLVLDIRAADVPYQLSLVSNGWPRHMLYRGHPGGEMPRLVRCDLAPWAGQPVLLELLAGPGDGELRLSICRLWTEAEGTPPRQQPALGARGAAVATRPSLLLVVFDALARRHVHALGHIRQTTPMLDGLIEKGTLFTGAKASASSTLGSVDLLLSGQELGGHGALPAAAGWESRPGEDAPRLARLLREQGWDTFALVSHSEGAAGRGLEDGFNSWLDLATDGSADDGPRLAARLEQRLRSVGAAPFFGYVHVFEPRAPYDVAPALRPAFVRPYDGPVRVDRAWMEAVQSGAAEVERTDWQHLGDLYDARVRLADEVLAQLLAALARSGRDSDTIVVVTSAHGEALGEHGAVGHGATAYSEELEVPLVFVVPGAASKRVPGPVTLADVAPTLLGLAGLPVPDSMDGIDLTAGSPTAGRARLACSDGWPPALAWSRGSLRIVVDLATRRRELFDRSVDPRETRNLWEIRPATAAWLYLELCDAVDAAVAAGLADAEILLRLQAPLRRP